MNPHLPAGSSARPPYDLVVTPETAGWGHTALRTLTLPAGGSHTFDTGEFETVVLPLAGSFTVTCEGEKFDLQGRRDVFSRVTDFAYVPRDAQVTVAGEGSLALPAARCDNRLAPRYGPAEHVPVEMRGAGLASRQVVNFATPDGFPHADRLIACEVYTPGGCWSSFPPHKHDERTAHESELEEIYYFAVRDGGRGYMRVHGTAGRPIDVLAEVRTGDVVLVPHGWHGPAMSPPGQDLYYLNVMAGPAPERAWRITDHPADAPVRDTWPGQPLDPRLPLTTPEERP